MGASGILANRETYRFVLQNFHSSLRRLHQRWPISVEVQRAENPKRFARIFRDRSVSHETQRRIKME